MQLAGNQGLENVIEYFSLQKAQALNYMYVLGCAVRTGRITFFFLLEAKNISHCWKLCCAVEDLCTCGKEKLLNACIPSSDKTKIWLFFFQKLGLYVLSICMEGFSMGIFHAHVFTWFCPGLINEWGTSLTSLNTWMYWINFLLCSTCQN